MKSLGLKLFSSNIHYFESAKKLINKESQAQFLELYAKPGTSMNAIHVWSEIQSPIITHAPHYSAGLNLSLPEKENSNFLMIEETMNMMKIWNSQDVIFHPGVNGDVKETIRQLKIVISKFPDKKYYIENKPKLGNGVGLVCVGYTIAEISEIINKTGCSFCLDFGHAISAANAQKLTPLEYISDFLKLAPSLFHLADGDFHSSYDSHLHLGDGDYPLDSIISLLPSDCKVTLETKKCFQDNLDDFYRDVQIFRLHDKLKS